MIKMLLIIIIDGLCRYAAAYDAPLLPRCFAMLMSAAPLLRIRFDYATAMRVCVEVMMREGA